MFLFPKSLAAQGNYEYSSCTANVWVAQGGPYNAGQNVTVEAYVWQTGQYCDVDEGCNAAYYADCTTTGGWSGGVIDGSVSLYDNSTYLGSYGGIDSYSFYYETSCYDEYGGYIGPCQQEASYNVYEWSVGLTGGSNTVTMYWSGNGGDQTPASGSVAITTSVASPSLSVSASPGSFSWGTNTTITATLSGGSNPTGTVTFYLGGSSIGSAGVSGSTATLSAGSSWSVGSHTLTAYYGGDSGNNAASSGGFGVTVNKASSATSVSSSANPSTYGGAVTFTATVTPGATGMVTFEDGATALGSGTISGTTATYTISALTGGCHSVTAVYGGNSNFNGSTSSVLTQTVNTAPVTVSITSNNNPATFGSSVTLTITLTSSGAVPTGTVTLADGVAPLGTLPLNGSGVATYTTSALSGGSHSLSATYNGDSNYH